MYDVDVPIIIGCCQTLNKNTFSFDGSSPWSINETVLFFYGGLEPGVTHSIKMTNLGTTNTQLAVTSFLVFKTHPTASESHKSNVGAIVGGVIGGIGLLALIALALTYVFKRRKAAARKRAEVDLLPPPPLEPFPRGQRAPVWQKGGTTDDYVHMQDLLQPQYGKRAGFESVRLLPLASSSSSAAPLGSRRTSTAARSMSQDLPRTSSTSTRPSDPPPSRVTEPIVEITVPAATDSRAVADIVAQRLEQQRLQTVEEERRGVEAPPRYRP